MKWLSKVLVPFLGLLAIVFVHGCGNLASTSGTASTATTTLQSVATGSPPIANAAIECYRYKADGTKESLGTTTADADGKWTLNVELSADISNVVVKATSTDGAKVRLAVQPLIEKGKTVNCKPTSAQDTIKARIFEKMKERGIDPTKFDMTKIDESMTQISTSEISPDNANDANIVKVAEAVETKNSAEDKFRDSVGISPTVWDTLRDYGYARYRVHSEAIFLAARNEKRAVKPEEYKEIDQKVQSDVLAKAVELGVSPSILSLMKEQANKQFEKKLEANLGATSKVTKQCKAYNQLNKIIRVFESKLNAAEAIIKYADPDNTTALTTLSTVRTNLLAKLKELAAKDTPPTEQDMSGVFQTFGSSVDSLFGVGSMGQVTTGGVVAKLLTKIGKTQADLQSFMQSVTVNFEENQTETQQIADRMKAIHQNMAAKIDQFFGTTLPVGVLEAIKTFALPVSM